MRAHGAASTSGGNNKKPAATKAWTVGESVVAKGKTGTSGVGPGASGPGEPRRGKVQRLRASGAVDIYYENGEVEERVSRERVATPVASTSSARRAAPAPARSRTPTKKKATQQQPERHGTPTSALRSSRSGDLSAKTASSSRIPRAGTASGAADKRGTGYVQPNDGFNSDVGGGNADNNLTDNNESASSRRRVPVASPEMPRRARTAGSNDTYDSSKSRSGASRRLPQSAGRNFDMSDAIAENQKLVTNILDLIAATDADATAVVGAVLFCCHTLGIAAVAWIFWLILVPHE